MTRRAETLELAVLGLLHDAPMHGYELRKQVTALLGWGRLLSYGSLYPALKRMRRAGWTREELTRAGPGRRQRIVYHLTPAGHARFTEMMQHAGPSTWEDESFDVRFAFFGRVEAEIRLRILEGRRTRLEERLERVQQQLDRTRKRMDHYAWEQQRHGVESVEREVRWLSEMIDAERTGQTAPDHTRHT